MTREKIIEVLDRHFNNYYNSTTDLIKKAVADEILESRQKQVVSAEEFLESLNIDVRKFVHIKTPMYSSEGKAIMLAELLRQYAQAVNGVDDVKDILQDLLCYWDTCPEEYKERIRRIIN